MTQQHQQFIVPITQIEVNLQRLNLIDQLNVYLRVSLDIKLLFLFFLFLVYFLLVVMCLTVFTGFLVVLPGRTLQKYFEVNMQMKQSSLLSSTFSFEMDRDSACFSVSNTAGCDLQAHTCWHGSVQFSPFLIY